VRRKVGASWASAKGRWAAREWFRWVSQGEDNVGLWAAAEGKEEKGGLCHCWVGWGAHEEIREVWHGLRKIGSKQILLKESPF
jgi:hypothetical protein